MQIEINTDVLEAVCLFRAISDVRYYLNGVCLQTGPQGARLIGCDGHTLGIANLGGTGYPEQQIIIPNSILTAFKYNKKFKFLLVLTFDDVKPTKPPLPRTITAQYGQVKMECQEVEGIFPDWMRVLPMKTSGEPAQYNPEYLMRLTKAGEMLNGGRSKHSTRYPGISMNGNNSGLSVIRDDFLAIIMPMRTEQATSTPDWAFAKLSTPLEEAKVAEKHEEAVAA